MEVKLSASMRRNTPAIRRLEAIAKLLDELRAHLDRVEFLSEDIVDKRAMEQADDLASKARAALDGVRDAVAKKGGGNVAKEYK
ncbi:hypothetical protein AB8O55_07100 [Saccharopolyspora cebuensis]|uniref:Uncharacterized protein n=1 Tax=Saccharopolyspora cebuensis TaxID=418759 RepID=A0ABV4CDI7_9PSEU